MKEKSDFLEVEFKFRPDGHEEHALELVRRTLPPGTRLLQKPAAAYFDLYLDTAALDLDRSGASLRVRFGDKSFGKRARYRSNFKTGQPSEGDRWLSRREVMTDLSREEMLAFRTAPLPGLAATLARELVQEVTGTALPLEPILVISTFRRYFTVRPPVDEPDHMLMAVEQSIALAARDLDIGLLLSKGMIDWTDPGPLFEFDLCEVELTVEDNPVAEQTFTNLSHAVAADFETMTLTKYKWCLAELGIADASAAR